MRLREYPRAVEWVTPPVKCLQSDLTARGPTAEWLSLALELAAQGEAI